MRRFFIRFFTFLLMVCLIQGHIYIASGAAKAVYPDFVHRLRRAFAAGPDILWLGDSVLINAGPADENQPALPDMLRRWFPDRFVVGMGWPALHMGIYRAVCRDAVRQKAGVKAVIVPINLRSFSPEWNLRPGYQFETWRVLLQHDNLWLRVFFKPLCVFRAVDAEPIPLQRFENEPVWDGTKKAGVVRDFLHMRRGEYTDKKMAEIIRLYYLQPWDARHRRLADLRRLAAYLRRNSIQGIFYVTPIDVQTCRAFVGPAIDAKIARDTDLVAGVLREEGFALLDLSRGLDAGAFDWRPTRYVNEHLNEKGRLFVARKVALAVRGAGVFPIAAPAPPR